MREGSSLTGCADTVVDTKPAASFHASLSTGACVLSLIGLAYKLWTGSH